MGLFTRRPSLDDSDSSMGGEILGNHESKNVDSSLQRVPLTRSGTSISHGFTMI